MVINAAGVYIPYGRGNFLRLGDVQDALGIGKDTLARRVQPELHRMQLGNKNRLFPSRYIGGLVTFISDSSTSAKHVPFAKYAHNFAQTDQAQELILESEAEFESMTIDSSVTIPGNEQVISARAVGLLLGFKHQTVVHDWAERPDMLPPANIRVGDVPYLDTYFTLGALREFCMWQRPI